MNQRLLSLDAFRGFTIAAMLLVNNPGDWGHLYGPLGHAHWDGWTFTDTIFPFFVFISGISMTMSLGRRAAQVNAGPSQVDLTPSGGGRRMSPASGLHFGDSKTALLVQTVRRGLVIIAIGLALNLIPSFDWSTLRYPGVLQRLGLCTILTAPLVLWFSPRQQAWWIVGLLLAYSLVMLCVPVPDAAGAWHIGSLAPGEDVGAWLDRLLMDGHLWRSSKTWDPEGLLSTVPAVASQLVGVLAGHLLAAKRQPAEKAMWLMVSGIALLCLGQITGAWLMPINKSLWTPSFVLLMGGWACLGFGAFYWLLDAMPLPLQRARLARLAHPLVVFGMNALFLFALSGLVAKLLGFIKLGSGQTLKGALYAPIEALGLAPVNASLLFAIGFVAVMYAVAWLMWRRQIFVKV